MKEPTWWTPIRGSKSSSTHPLARSSTITKTAGIQPTTVSAGRSMTIKHKKYHQYHHLNKHHQFGKKTDENKQEQAYHKELSITKEELRILQYITIAFMLPLPTIIPIPSAISMCFLGHQNKNWSILTLDLSPCEWGTLQDASIDREDIDLCSFGRKIRRIGCVGGREAVREDSLGRIEVIMVPAWSGEDVRRGESRGLKLLHDWVGDCCRSSWILGHKWGKLHFILIF